MNIVPSMNIIPKGSAAGGNPSAHTGTKSTELELSQCSKYRHATPVQPCNIIAVDPILVLAFEATSVVHLYSLSEAG